jgi:hypothetical protein
MSREQLRTWAAADQALEEAEVVLIVGYSFAAADAHFNDVLRKSATNARIVVVNLDLGGVLEAVSRAVDVDPTKLRCSSYEGIECRVSRRLSFVAGKAETVTADLISKVLR